METCRISQLLADVAWNARNTTPTNVSHCLRPGTRRVRIVIRRDDDLIEIKAAVCVWDAMVAIERHGAWLIPDYAPS